MPHTIGANVKLLATYGVDHYGTDVTLPIHDTLAVTTIAISGTTITQSTDGGNVPIEEQPEIYSDTDTLQFYNEGDDTEYDQTYRWTPDMSAVVYKTHLEIAFVLNVSAYTSGTFDLTNAIITISEQPDAKVIYANNFAVTMAGLTGIGDAMFVLNADVVEAFKVFSGNPIDIRIQTTTATGVGTSQVGVAAAFCLSTPANMKPFRQSAVTLHIHASLDHADPIFNQDITRIL